MADIELEEIDRWLASIDTEAADAAARAYMNAKRQHVTGERPKWCRVEWHNLPKDYRAFLVSIAQAGIDAAKFIETKSAS